MNTKISNIKYQISNTGFTLIELLVVISIIGALATLLFSNFMGVRQRGKDTQRKSDIEQIRKALEMYKGSQNPPTYPANLSALSSGNFMQTVPQDPNCPGGTCTGSWVIYRYRLNPPPASAGNLTYDLVACLENSSDQQKDNPINTYCNSTQANPASYTRTEP